MVVNARLAVPGSLPVRPSKSVPLMPSGIETVSWSVIVGSLSVTVTPLKRLTGDPSVEIWSATVPVIERVISVYLWGSDGHRQAASHAPDRPRHRHLPRERAGAS